MVPPADYPRFAICESEVNGRTRLTLKGELDLATAPMVKHQLKQLRADSEVGLDLSKLQFIDCAGMRVLVRAVTDARSKGVRLDVEGKLAPQVKRLAELTHPELSR